MSRPRAGNYLQRSYPLGAPEGGDACLVEGSATGDSATEGGGCGDWDQERAEGQEGGGGCIGRFGGGEDFGLGARRGGGAASCKFLSFSDFSPLGGKE